ncbi:hypothetical protein JCM8097_007848 [Rhodosporidiobolus ruineniae]
MPGKDATATGGKDGDKKKKQAISASKRAGLEFPVGRIRKYLKQSHRDRLSATAPVFLAAVLEYLVAEICELAGNASRDNKKSRITPRHIQLAIGNDEELSKMLDGVTISQGGVLPNIHSCLIGHSHFSGRKSGASTKASSSKADSSSAASKTAKGKGGKKVDAAAAGEKDVDGQEESRQETLVESHEL